MSAVPAIGNQTSYGSATIMEPFEFAVNNGFDAFEWFPDRRQTGEGWKESDVDTASRKRIKNRAARAGLRLSVHAPWHLNPLDEADRERLLESADFARDLDAKVLNIHINLECGTERFTDAIAPLAEYLGEFGAALSIENIVDSAPEDFNTLFGVLSGQSAGGTRNIGMCLDLGHANIHESTRNDFVAYLDRLCPEVPIIHCHVHENFGDADSHLPLFTGPSAVNPVGIEMFVARMKGRGFAGSMIMEQWPTPPRLLVNARDGLRELFVRGN